MAYATKTKKPRAWDRILASFRLKGTVNIWLPSWRKAIKEVLLLSAITRKTKCEDHVDSLPLGEKRLLT